jgi:diguanylate cyclase (GGDEF)-like protein
MLASPGIGSRVRARHRHKDGSWVWMELTNNNLLGRPGGRVITEMVDVSDEMSAIETLRQREQLLSRLAEALPTGVLHVDRHRSVRYSNSRLHSLLGTAPSQKVDDQLAQVVSTDRAALSHLLDRVLGGGGDADVEVGVQIEGQRLARRCAIAIRALTDSDDVTVGAVVCVDDVTESSTVRTELERRATVDELTGCLNRGAVLEELQRSLLDNVPGARGMAIVFLDLDGFKEVNDTFGHLAGDQLLSSAARRLCSAMREEDVIGRLGGDEFLVLLPGIKGAAAAMAMAGRLAEALAEPLEAVMGHPTRIRSSIGVAWSDSPMTSGDALVAAADVAMYASKAARACEPVLAGL